MSQDRKVSQPTQSRGKQTYEKLLSSAQKLLAEEGPEALNSNAIVERAGLTPPAFYRYFTDKYMLMSVLCERLMDAQNELGIEVMPSLEDSHEAIVQTTAQLFKEHIRVTNSFVGGFELMVLMRALPELRPIRLESHKSMAEIVYGSMRQFEQDAPPAALRARSRLIVETFYSTLEMLYETEFQNRSEMIRRCAVAISAIYRHPAD